LFNTLGVIRARQKWRLCGAEIQCELIALSGRQNQPSWRILATSKVVAESLNI
jgi:hypothetical protein